MESHKSVSHSIKAAWESVCGVRERNSAVAVRDPWRGSTLVKLQQPHLSRAQPDQKILSAFSSRVKFYLMKTDGIIFLPRHGKCASEREKTVFEWIYLYQAPLRDAVRAPRRELSFIRARNVHTLFNFPCAFDQQRSTERAWEKRGTA